MSVRVATRTFAKSRFCPWLEGLEERYCPALPNMPPYLDMTINQLDQRTVVLSGWVKDENPTGAVINFSGAFTGSTVSGEDGSFCLTVEADTVGQVFAIATDDAAQQSNECVAAIQNRAPQIVGFTASLISGTTWQFTGSVMDEWAAGLEIFFGGLTSLIGKSVQVQADGSFSLCVELAQGEQGVASARCDDWWGFASNEAETLVVPV